MLSDYRNLWNSSGSIAHLSIVRKELYARYDNFNLIGDVLIVS